MDPITAEVIIPITLFVATALILYYYLRTRHQERMQIIEKGVSEEQVKYLLKTQKPKPNPLNSIKYGLLLIAVGLAIFLGTLAPGSEQEEITFGLIFLLPGISLVIFYYIANRRTRGEKPEQGE